MKETAIIIKHSLFINKPRELVWDYTQNYDNRKIWDNAVIESTIVQYSPNRIVKLKMKGNTTMTFIYKLDDRPNKTTLVASDIISPFIKSAGGSWSYEEQNKGTLWNLTNSIELKNKLIVKLFSPLYKKVLISQTKKAMVKAKRIIEKL